MRFMVLVKASKNSEAGKMPSPELLAAMGKFNDELSKAGVMLAGEGLQASSKGARVRFDGAKRTVTDGPFAETKELVAGFWIWKCKSLQEAVEWVKRSGIHCNRGIVVTDTMQTITDPRVYSVGECASVGSVGLVRLIALGVYRPGTAPSSRWGKQRTRKR